MRHDFASFGWFSRDEPLGGTRMIITSAAAVLCTVIAFAALQATQVPDVPLSLSKVFTFLFLTLGPFKIIGPFAAMTRGRDGAFKRELALRGTLVAALGLLAAASIGAYMLQKWGISVGALQLTAGIILFLVALKPVLEQYERRDAPSEVAGSGAAPTAVPASRLAISPLAFPTIVTPWGLAVLIMVVTLWTGHALEILGVTVAVLVLNFVAMLSVERIVKTPFVVTALAIVGMVLGVLQVALGVQAAVNGLRLLGLVGSG